MQGNNIIDRLFVSFGELEVAIESAKATLAKKQTVPVEILKRLESYDQILVKQRSLAAELRQFLDQGEWDSVARHVNLINGLSAMIRDDARAILTALAPDTKANADDEAMNFC